MSRIVIAPYHMRVSAAREIARAVGGIRVKRLSSNYRFRRGDLVINWGRTDLPEYPSRLNSASCVKDAVNKLRALSIFGHNGVPTVEWTTDRDSADTWLHGGDIVLARTRLAGRGGEGILVADGTRPLPPGRIAPAPLYTRYFKHKDEFRVHMWRGQVIDIQKKKLRTEVRDRIRQDGNPGNTYTIRSHSNGWVFAREGIVCPQPVLEAATRAVDSLGLDFGAVDIGWNRHHNRAAVFEVNTAPGIEGTTLQKYIEAIGDLA